PRIGCATAPERIALRVAVRPGKIEERVVGFGEEPDHADARQIGLFRPATRVPKSRHPHARLTARRRWRRLSGAAKRRHQQEADGQPTDQGLRGMFLTILKDTLPFAQMSTNRIKVLFG